MKIPVNKPSSRRPAAGDEQGSIIIEVLVSSIMLVIVAVGVFSAFDAAARSTAEERHRAQAHSLAQSDLARMRTMRISDLSNLDESRVETVDGTPYTVDSIATFQTDATGTASCESGTASADYIQIRATVSWPSIGSRPPVVAQSLVAPPNGSVSPDTGALAVQIEDAENVGIEGVGLSGTGDGSFSGATGENGCAIFANLPEGNYTLSVSGSSLVDRDGSPPEPQSTSVVAESTNTVVLQYDDPGSIPVSFETRANGAGNDPVPSSADSVVVFNTGMTVAKTFGTPGTPLAEVSATSLFPFTSPYAVYAGTCDGDNPNPAGEPDPPAAIADVLVSPGGASPVTIELPALHLIAWSGTDAGSPGAAVEGAQVKLADTNCSPEDPLVRTFTTNTAGGLDDPGLPFSTYDVCVDDGLNHIEVDAVDVPFDAEDMEAGTDLDVYLGNAAAQSGACP